MTHDDSEIEKFFLEAMAHGYAQGVEETTITELPGSKAIHYESGNFKLIDCWLTSPGFNWSAGWTNIWRDGVLVWTMSYEGYYVEEVIPFLKKCLNEAYVKEKRFYAGRGPLRFRNERFTYINRFGQPSTPCFIRAFDGEEEIFERQTDNRMGYHRYRNMSLLSNFR